MNNPSAMLLAVLLFIIMALALFGLGHVDGCDSNGGYGGVVAPDRRSY